MILPIYIYGQPVLRKVAQDITPDYPELKELISDMFVLKETIFAFVQVNNIQPFQTTNP